MATTTQALAAGFSLSAIHRAVGGGEWTTVHRGIYFVDPSADPVRAAIFGQTLRAPGETWASHWSATWLWGIEASVPLKPEISTTANLRGGRAKIRRLTAMPERDATTRFGIPITSCPRTVVDLAAVTTPARLEGAIAEAARQGLVTRDELHECAAATSARRQRGGRLVLRVLDGWERGMPESVLESRLAKLLAAEVFRCLEASTAFTTETASWPAWTSRIRSRWLP